MYSLYIGCKPVLNKEKVIEFYEVLCSQNERNEGFVFDTLLTEALCKIGTKEVLGSRKAFVKVDEEMLKSGAVFDIPNSFFIIGIPAAEEISQEIKSKTALLKERGYALALYDFTPNELYMQRYESILEEFSFVKISISDEFGDEGKKVLKHLKEKGISLIADEVKTMERYRVYEDMHCDLFEGYYFLNAAFFENEEHAASKEEVLRLYGALMRDSEFDAIEQEFKNCASMTLLLLKYINSGAFHFKNRISSVRHILTLVGREPLSKWLLMIMYSAPYSTNKRLSSLMHTVKCRAELMENILKKIVPDVDNVILNQGYFVSVLSLADVLFGEDTKTILDDLNIYDAVRIALLDGHGVLGRVYALIKDIEEFRVEGIAEFESRYELEFGTISQILIDSMSAVAAFEKAVDLMDR